MPTPPLLAVLTGCRNSRTARTLRRVSVLCSAPLLESLSWCQPLLESLSWCQPLLESLSWCQPLLESLSWCQPGVRLPPRVTIVVPTVGLADWVGLPNPHSCRYCGTNPGFDFLLVSLTWFKPRERLSLANGWMCQYPYGKDSGFRLGSRTGGKVTCRNSKTARNLFRASVLWSAASSSRYRGVRHPPRVVIVVPARGSTSSSCRHRWLKPWV